MALMGTRLHTVSETSGQLSLKSNHDVAMARLHVKRLSEELGFSAFGQTRIVTATSELARNTLIYGGGGDMRWEIVQAEARPGLRLTFEDHGPGIADLDWAMGDRHTSGRGLGMGLSGARRLVDEFEIQSHVGSGTRVSILCCK
jgi:serine/threonine-protein kinase RsbT